jgi:alcohol dehydrogenase class IV
MPKSISLPRELRVGAGASRELGAILENNGWSRPLIVTDRFLEGTGAVARLVDGLGEGIKAEVFAETSPDPDDTCVNAAAQAVLAGQHDCVVGFGGGSPMDTAKAAGLLAAAGGKMRDYRAPATTDAAALPVIAIPTTAGSGSECTRFTVITDTETDEKMLCTGLAFLPLVALVDYELTLTMPPRLTADTGVDALSHAIEAYVSRRASPFTDALALAAIRGISLSIRKVYREPDDRPAREAMMLAATQAGIAFSNSSVALVHGMSRPIGAHFGIAHGLSNAMLLPAVTAFSVTAAADRYADCARAMGVASVDDSDVQASWKLVGALINLNHDLDVPTPAECGIDRQRWQQLIPLMAAQAVGSGSPANNPREPSVEEIHELYANLIGGEQLEAAPVGDQP